MQLSILTAALLLASTGVAIPTIYSSLITDSDLIPHTDMFATVTNMTIPSQPLPATTQPAEKEDLDKIHRQHAWETKLLHKYGYIGRCRRIFKQRGLCFKPRVFRHWFMNLKRDIKLPKKVRFCEGKCHFLDWDGEAEEEGEERLTIWMDKVGNWTVYPMVTSVKLE